MATKNKPLKIEAVDLLDERWINTPYAFSKLGGDLSLLHQDILFRVSSHLQEHIKRFFEDGKHKDKNTSNCLFPDLFLEHNRVNNIPDIKIKTSELGISDAHYSDLRKALSDIMHLQMAGYNEKTKNYTIYNVFTQCEMPYKKDGYKRKDKEGNIVFYDRSEPYIEIRFNQDAVSYVLDMSKGYINHLDMIARYSRKKYTPRFYMMLKYYGNFRNEVKIPFLEVKEYLGMVKRDEKTNMVTEIKYPLFWRFRKQVIDVAKEDLDRMAELNQTDIVFDYKPIYSKGKTEKGNPDYIEFIIKNSALGNKRLEIKKGEKKKNIGATMQINEDVIEGIDKWKVFLNNYQGTAKEALKGVQYLGLKNNMFSVKATRAEIDEINNDWQQISIFAFSALGLPPNGKAPIILTE